jgi:DNA polymerase elongation subunit (family B)
MADDQKVKFKGAYTEMVAEPCKLYHDVMCLDYAGLYPSVIISRNIDLLTFSRDP